MALVFNVFGETENPKEANLPNERCVRACAVCLFVILYPVIIISFTVGGHTT